MNAQRTHCESLLNVSQVHIAMRRIARIAERHMSLSFAYCAMILGVICFQIALIFGAPWGRITQGGQNDGPLPISGRLVAAASIFILLGMALAVLSADGRWPGWPSWTLWIALAVNALSMVLNWITPSKQERRLWAPIMTVMFLLAVAVFWF